MHCQGCSAFSKRGTYSYLDAGLEQTVFEIIADPAALYIPGFFLDLSAMTQNGTIKVYCKIDGTTYREINSWAFTVADADDYNYYEMNWGTSRDIKVTYTEGADEGAARNIIYDCIATRYGRV